MRGTTAARGELGCLASRETPAGVVKGRSSMPEIPTMGNSAGMRGARVDAQKQRGVLQRDCEGCCWTGGEWEKRDAGLLRANLTKKARAAISPAKHLLFWAPRRSFVRCQPITHHYRQTNPNCDHHHDGSEPTIFPSAFREAIAAPPIQVSPFSLPCLLRPPPWTLPSP